MKILCAYSGIEFRCDHFPASLTARECYHPIFAVPQKKLLGYMGKWAGNELTETDSYLLFLALLNSTELVEWRVPVTRTARTASIVANNMEPLARIVGKMNVINHPAFVCAHIAITPDSKYLDSARYWIQSWESSFTEFQSGYRNAIRHDRLVIRERALEKIILGLNVPHSDRDKQMTHAARHIADWAADAGCFPTTTVLARDMKTPMSLADYWKDIIIACVKQEKIFSIRKGDLEDLVEHCENNIEPGTIYHKTLMDILRGGLKKQISYLGLGDIDISSVTSSFKIIGADMSVEDANKLALIQSAPQEKPKRENYETYIQYARAKLNWDMKVDYLARGGKL